MADGPAEIGAGWRVDWFARAISDSLSHFPKEIAEPIMRRYCADEAKVSSHYPWVAFAIAGYRRASLSRSDADLAPSEMQKVLQSISNKATELNELLEIVDRAGSAANRAGNVSKFKAYAAVDRKLIDVLSRKFGDVRTDDDWAEADDWRLALRLLPQYANEAALEIATDDAAKGGSGPRLVGAVGLVSVLSAVWQSMTGRRASAEKIKKQKLSDDPPFVRFIADLAIAAEIPAPSRRTVQTLLTPQ
jgi:hypothetical protein